MSKPAAPKILGEVGAKLWCDLVGKYDFRLDELAVLERACRTLDRLAAMEDELGDELLTTGSMGQTVVHPLVAEIRAHTAQLAALMKQLGFPDDPAIPKLGAAPNQHRQAAQSRWAAAHGAGA